MDLIIKGIPNSGKPLLGIPNLTRTGWDSRGNYPTLFEPDRVMHLQVWISEGRNSLMVHLQMNGFETVNFDRPKTITILMT